MNIIVKLKQWKKYATGDPPLPIPYSYNTLIAAYLGLSWWDNPMLRKNINLMKK